MFAALLHNLAKLDLIAQMKDGLLIHGSRGEKIVNNYDFYSAFVTPDEYRLITSGKPLGTLPIVNPVAERSFLIFAGRRWRVVAVDQEKHVIDLVPAAGGRVPVFNNGSRGDVHDRVRAEMRDIYAGIDIPPYLDAPSADLLHEGRENFARLGLERTNYIRCGEGTFYFPWRGTVAMNTLVQQLAKRDVAASMEGPAIVAHGLDASELRDVVAACDSERPMDTIALAAQVENKVEEKWDWALDEQMLRVSYASRRMVNSDGVPDELS